MDLSVTDVAALVSTLLLGVSAGIFFAYSNSVMPGLRRVDDQSYVTVFTSIDRAIQNPLFFLVFIGALIAPGVTAGIAFAAGEGTQGWWAVAAAVVYLVGVVGVTGAVNVPLNNALAQNRDRGAFEARWVRFNHLRTVASIAAFALGLATIVA